MIWAYLMQLSYNMSADRETPHRPAHVVARPFLRFDESLWRDMLPAMSRAGEDSFPGIDGVRAYRDLEDAGYEQIPTGSNHSNAVNFGRTVDYCRRVIAPERLLGFLQTVWRPTTEEFRAEHMAAIEQVGAACAAW